MIQILFFLLNFFLCYACPRYLKFKQDLLYFGASDSCAVSIHYCATRFYASRFLAATKHRYNWLCPLVGWSVCLSVCNAFVRGSTRCTLLAYLALFFVSCQDLHPRRALILILLFLRNSIRRKRFLLCF